MLYGIFGWEIILYRVVYGVFMTTDTRVRGRMLWSPRTVHIHNNINTAHTHKYLCRTTAFMQKLGSHCVPATVALALGLLTT